MTQLNGSQDSVINTEDAKQLSLPTPEDMTNAIKSIDTLAEWLLKSGLQPAAIAQWKLNSLVHTFPNYPALNKIVEDAKLIVRATAPTQVGMSVTEIANKLSESLENKIKAEQVNLALVSLGFQVYLQDKRVWQLTEAGSEYGQSFLATSKSNKWSGPRVTWNDAVLPLLEQYFLSQPESAPEPATAQKPGQQKSKTTTKTSQSTTSEPEFCFLEDRIKVLKQKVSADQLMHMDMELVAAYQEKYDGQSPKKKRRGNKYSNAYPINEQELIDKIIDKVLARYQKA